MNLSLLLAMTSDFMYPTGRYSRRPEETSGTAMYAVCGCLICVNSAGVAASLRTEAVALFERSSATSFKRSRISGNHVIGQLHADEP